MEIAKRQTPYSMYKNNAHNMQNTRIKIIDAARKLFSEYTYSGVSMSDIAKKLNITKAAIYYHFTSKLEIYENVLNEIFNILKSLIDDALKEETTYKKIHKLITNYITFGLEEKTLIRDAVLKSLPEESFIRNYISQFRKEIEDAMQPLIKDSIKNKKINKDVDYKLLTSLLINMMDGLILEYSFSNKKVDPARTADKIITVFSLSDCCVNSG